MAQTKAEAKYSKACNSCKQKKRRCDRATPKCGYCDRNGLPCEFRTLQKPGLPLGYGSTMLEKLEFLDSSIQENHETSLIELQSVVEYLKLIDSKVLQILSRSAKHDDSTRQALSIKSLTSSSNENISISHNSATTVNSDENLLHSNGHDIMLLPGQNAVLSWPLPSMGIICKLIDVFFEKIYPGFRALHPTFRNDIIVSVSQIDRVSEASEVPPEILGVILCSIRFAGELMPPQQIETCQKFCRTTILSKCIGFSLIEQLQAMALLAYDSYGRSNNPVTWSYISLISNAVIHLNLTREPVMKEPYQAKTNYSRSKKAKIISPPNVANLEAPTTPFDEECRRNLFWEIFLLDCLSSASNSLPCKIIETDINRQVPVRSDMWNIPESYQGGSIDVNSGDHGHFDSASDLVEIVRKLRKIHTFLREPFDINNVKEVLAWQMQLSEIDAELLDWKDSIPLHYQQFLDSQTITFTEKLSVKDVLFFSIYHMTIIRLNSSIAYQKFDSHFFLLSSTAKEKCLESAKGIASFSSKLPIHLDHLGEDLYALCGPFYAFAIWVAARLLFVNALRYGEPFSSELDQLISVLSIMGTVWESASRYSDILSFLKNEEIEIRANGLSLLTEADNFDDLDKTNVDNDIKDPFENHSHHSKSARIFADMRFNAYSLDVSLSKKLDQFKKSGEELSPNNRTDFTNLLEWFKIPISVEDSPFRHRMEP